MLGPCGLALSSIPGTIPRTTGFTFAGAAPSKTAALRRLRMARPHPIYDPPQIGWVKETTTTNKPWKALTTRRPARVPARRRR